VHRLVERPSVPMKITTPGRSAKCTFRGRAGQRISAVITNPVTSDDNCETLTLLGPGGGTVKSSTGCGNGNPVGVGPVDLTAAGTYRVRLEADPYATASSTLWVSVPITIGTATVNGPARPMKATRVGQGVQRTFRGTAHEHVKLVLSNVITSNDDCETLTLLNPAKGNVASATGCGNGNPVDLGPVTLRRAGSYTVRFEPDVIATGHGSLKIST
jgi:hypothetical protein